MTENEAKAIKWMKNVRDDAVVTLDHIKENEPNVSPMVYAGRKERAETIIAGFEELEQYRAIGTVEEFKALKEKNEPKKPQNIDGEHGTFDCPTCGHTLIAIDDMTIHQNCLLCGQRFKWNTCTDTSCLYYSPDEDCPARNGCGGYQSE